MSLHVRCKCGLDGANQGRVERRVGTIANHSGSTTGRAENIGEGSSWRRRRRSGPGRRSGADDKGSLGVSHAKHPTPEGIVGKKGHHGEELSEPVKTEEIILRIRLIKESGANECSILSWGSRGAHDLTDRESVGQEC
jgi:hypothetical protein